MAARKKLVPPIDESMEWLLEISQEENISFYKLADEEENKNALSGVLAYRQSVYTPTRMQRVGAPSAPASLSGRQCSV